MSGTHGLEFQFCHLLVSGQWQILNAYENNNTYVTESSRELNSHNKGKNMAEVIYALS